MKSIGDRLGDARESRAGQPLDWIKAKMIDAYFFYIGG